MKEKVLDTIRKYKLIQNGDKLVLGVSGGPDSLCMLFIFNEICQSRELGVDFDFVVAHVNHKIREDADDDAKFVKDVCKKLGIEFYEKSIDVLDFAHNKKMGTEEAGREIRYDFFDEVMQKVGANKVAIAHHKNDKVETIFMNLLRGSGISGLRGIEPIKENRYIRPLIECERSEIEQYCNDNNLQPRMDSTNLDNTYTRNKIRNVLIPYIQREFNPNIIQTIERLSELIQEEDEYLQKQTQKIFTEILIQEDLPILIKLDLKKFNLQDKVIKSRLLRYTIMRLLGNIQGIGKIHMDDMIKLCENNIGNKFLVPNKNLKVLVKNGQITFFSQK